MTFWTSNRISELHSLWHDGKSAVYICKALNAPSRNAVLGKLWRDGLIPRGNKNPAALVIEHSKRAKAHARAFAAANRR